MGLIITGDETWFYGYDPERKRESSQWSLLIFRDQKSAPGAVKSQSHAHGFLWYGGHCSLWVRSTRPNCKPVVYLQVLKRLRLAVSRKRPHKRAARAWALHHDNAPAHTAHSIQVFLASRGIPDVHLSWHGSVWLLVCPSIKNGVEREEIWRHWRNSEECVKYAEHHTKRLFWKLLNIFSH